MMHAASIGLLGQLLNGVLRTSVSLAQCIELRLQLVQRLYGPIRIECLGGCASR